MTSKDLDSRNQYFYLLLSFYEELMLSRGVQFYSISSNGVLKSDWFPDNLSRIELIAASYRSYRDKFDNQGNLSMRSYRGFFGVRSLIGLNPSMDSQIRTALAFAAPSIEIRRISSMDELRTLFIHLVEDYSFEEQQYCFFTDTHYLEEYNGLYDYINVCFIDRLEREAKIPEARFIPIEPSSVVPIHHYGHLSPLSNRDIVIFLLDLYMRDRGMLLYEGNLYSKTADLEWVMYKELHKLLEDLFEIITFLVDEFPVQLGGAELPKVFMGGFDEALSLISRIPVLLPTGVVWNGVLESDGRPPFSALMRYSVVRAYSIKNNRNRDLRYKEWRSISGRYLTPELARRPVSL